MRPSLKCEWLPTMDLNHDKQIQSLLCYRYTSRQSDRQQISISGLFKQSRNIYLLILPQNEEGLS